MRDFPSFAESRRSLNKTTTHLRYGRCNCLALPVNALSELILYNQQDWQAKILCNQLGR
jgi:hypothetical protein